MLNCNNSANNKKQEQSDLQSYSENMKNGERQMEVLRKRNFKAEVEKIKTKQFQETGKKKEAKLFDIKKISTEISQGKTDSICYHLHVEFEK